MRLAIAVGMGVMLAACGDPFVGNWTVEQHLDASPQTGCPSMFPDTAQFWVEATSTAGEYRVAPADPAWPWETVTVADDALAFIAPVPTERSDIGSARYEVTPGGDGLVGTALWQVLISSPATGDPPGACPELVVRSIDRVQRKK